MFSKSGRNYLIKSAYFLRFQQWYIHPDRWTIEGDMTILWSITKLGKSVHRVIWDGNNLFAPDLLFFLMDFSQVWYRWKAITKGNPTPYVTKGWDYSLWKTLAITKIAPLRSSWSYLLYIQSGLILSGHFPHLGYSPPIPHHWKSSLMWISGRNTGFTSVLQGFEVLV